MAVEEMTVNGTALNQALLSELSGLLGELREDVSKLQQRVQFASQLDTVRETICEEYVDQFLRGDYSSEHLVSAFEKRFYTKWLNSVYEHTDLGSFNADEMERYLRGLPQLRSRTARTREDRGPTLNH